MKYGIAFSDLRKYPIDQGILCDAVSWMDASAKEYPGFVKSNPAKLPKLVVKALSLMKNTALKVNGLLPMQLQERLLLVCKKIVMKLADTE